MKRSHKSGPDVTLAFGGGNQRKAHKMAKDSTGKLSVEAEVKTLQKHMGAALMTIKSLKDTIKALEKRMLERENEEVKEILEKQRVLEEVLAANSEAITRIDMEIEKMGQAKVEVEASKDATTEQVYSDNGTANPKKCRYYNRGYCKYDKRCRYFHPREICQDYLEHQKCETKGCGKRHPRRCKWDQSKEGCKRNLDCVYLHGVQSNEEVENVGNMNVNVAEDYQCVSCKCAWKDRNCLVMHDIQSTSVYFCLNCDDWVKNKMAVFDQGWSLLDNEGYLRNGI